MKKQIAIAIIVVILCLFVASQVGAQHTFDPPEYTECEKAYNALDLAEIEVSMYARHIFRDTTYKPTLAEATRYINSTITYKQLWVEACVTCEWGNCAYLFQEKTLRELTDMYYQYRNQ